MSTPSPLNKSRLSEIPLSSIRPKGFIREFLDRQRQGLSGHFQAQGYPFDTCLWEGVIPSFFQETEYNGKSVPSMPGNWWPYEQSAYLLDGLMRLGILLEDDEMLSLFRRNLDYLLAHPAPDGRLGGAFYNHHSEWPMAVFYKAVSAYLKVYPDQKIIDAFHRHFSAVSIEETSDEFRNITTIEGMLDIARLTGDEALRQKAFDAYGRFDRKDPGHGPYDALTLNKLKNLKNIVFHGVSLCEEIKLPVLLYMAGGDPEYLHAAEDAWHRVMEMHGQIPGLPCAVEYAFGRDPQLGYETCVISDSLYSLGFFLMAEGNAAYADQMEKIAFNALPGAVLKDFSALQYLSAPNQVIATGFSQTSSLFRGKSAWRQFRPDHFPSCCSGNVHRAMSNYVARQWLADADGCPVAALYGASTFSGTLQGTPVQIEEETEYPFGDTIRFHFHMRQPIDFPFTFRIPAWCDAATLQLNDEAPLSLTDAKEKFLAWNRRWQDGDTLTLTLPMRPVQKHDRQWTWFECGPLVYSLPLEYTLLKEAPEKDFSPLRLTPAGRWAYAVKPGCTPVLQRKAVGDAYPYDKAPCTLKISANEAHGRFEELVQQRYTPNVPLSCPTGTEHPLELVPMGCTELRLTAFPDGVKRQLIPLLSGFVRDTEPDDARILNMEPEDFIKFAKEIPVDYSGYFDLARFLKKSINCQAWLMLRFWSDAEQEGTLAVMASDSAVGYFNGAPVLEITGMMDAEASEPLWFPVKIRKGRNYLLLKVIDGIPSPQHRDSWGAFAQLFVNQ